MPSMVTTVATTAAAASKKRQQLVVSSFQPLLLHHDFVRFLEYFRDDAPRQQQLLASAPASDALHLPVCAGAGVLLLWEGNIKQ